MEIQLTPGMLVLVPIVAMIIQRLKEVPQIKPHKKLLPIAAMVLGVLLIYAAPYLTFLLRGITIGIMAVGGFEMLKSNAKVARAEKKTVTKTVKQRK